jgi:hypothetical protein
MAAPTLAPPPPPPPPAAAAPPTPLAQVGPLLEIMIGSYHCLQIPIPVVAPEPEPEPEVRQGVYDGQGTVAVVLYEYEVSNFSKFLTLFMF